MCTVTVANRWQRTSVALTNTKPKTTAEAKAAAEVAHIYATHDTGKRGKKKKKKNYGIYVSPCMFIKSRKAWPFDSVPWLQIPIFHW